MSEAQQRLDEVRSSIRDVLEKGQSVRRDGRELKRADLESLRGLEKQYSDQVSAELAAQQKARSRILYPRI